MAYHGHRLLHLLRGAHVGLEAGFGGGVGVELIRGHPHRFRLVDQGLGDRGGVLDFFAAAGTVPNGPSTLALPGRMAGGNLRLRGWVVSGVDLRSAMAIGSGRIGWVARSAADLVEPGPNLGAASLGLAALARSTCCWIGGKGVAEG